MKLELKNVRVNNAMSEETTCFTATLYADGKKMAHCRNSGTGGMTDVRFIDEFNSESVQHVLEWCKDNPVVQSYRNKVMKFHDVSTRVDELLFEYLMKKELISRQKNSLVLHENNSNDPGFVIHKYLKLRMDIDTMMKDNQCRNILKQKILEYKHKNITVMNTNIDFKLLGL